MKAIVYATYGPPDSLVLQEVEKPVPNADEVLVKVRAASANPADWHALRGSPFFVRLSMGFPKPKRTILGSDIAGQVEAVGKDVTQFEIGDEVFGDLSTSGMGGFAEYTCVSEQMLARKPTNLSFEQAAAVPVAAITALQALRNAGQIEAGQRVLINGASGGVGTFAVQIAKALGADVTGFCSTRNVEMVRSIGADHVVDYTQEDFTQNGQQYDLILDAAAFRPLSDYKRALAPTGAYILVGGSTARLFQLMFMGPVLSKKEGQRFGTFMKKSKQSDMVFMKELLEDRKIVPVIDRRYPLSATPDAIRYLEEGHARGKIIITVGDEH